MIRKISVPLLIALLTVTWSLPEGWTQPKTDARKLYDRVMEEFKQKDYLAAQAGFELFLTLYPKSHLAGSAQFWIGECEYRLASYKKALNSFRKVLALFPSSPKVPGATLKVALIYKKLGQPEPARILFQRILVEFPNAPEATIAKNNLKE